jgi:hypothetical protein
MQVAMRASSKMMQVSRCTECTWKEEIDWSPTLDIDASRSRCMRHTAETGHRTIREYASSTEYVVKEIEPDVAEARAEAVAPEHAAPQVAKRRKAPRDLRAICRECGRIAEKATGIYVYWGASQHHRKTGHTIDIIEIEKSGTSTICKVMA